MDMLLEKWKAFGDRNKAAEFLDIMISGIAQMVFNYHPVTGLVLLAAAFAASPLQGISCLWAVLAGTVMVYLLRIPAAAAREGIYTYNSALIGMAIPLAVFHLDFHAFPLILAVTGAGSVLSVVLTLAMKKLFAKRAVSPMAAPYSLALLLIAAIACDGSFQGYSWCLENGESSWTMAEFLQSAMNGLAQIIWLEGVPWAGGAVLLAICCASRIDTAMAALTVTMATGLAIMLGIGHHDILLGLYGYNAVLIGLVFFGRAYRTSMRSFALAAFLSMLCVPAALALKPLLAAAGAPVAGFPFSILAILVTLGAPKMKKMTYHEPENWSVPEHLLS